MTFSPKNVSGPPNPPDELAQNVSKKNRVGRINPLFFFESSESDRDFNYSHDSNSIFSGRENYFRRSFRAHSERPGQKL